MGDDPVSGRADTEQPAPVEGDGGILVIRGSGTHRAWNGIRYKTGMSDDPARAGALRYAARSFVGARVHAARQVARGASSG